MESRNDRRNHATCRPPHKDGQNWRLTGWAEAINTLVQIEHRLVGDSWARIASDQISSLIPVAPNPQRIVHGPGRLDLANAIVKGQPLEFDLRSNNQQPSMGAQQLALRAIHTTAYPDVWQIEATYAGEHADIDNFVLQYNDAIRSGWLHNEY